MRHARGQRVAHPAYLVVQVPPVAHAHHPDGDPVAAARAGAVRQVLAVVADAEHGERHGGVVAERVWVQLHVRFLPAPQPMLQQQQQQQKRRFRLQKASVSLGLCWVASRFARGALIDLDVEGAVRLEAGVVEVEVAKPANGLRSRPKPPQFTCLYSTLLNQSNSIHSLQKPNQSNPLTEQAQTNPNQVQTNGFNPFSTHFQPKGNAQYYSEHQQASSSSSSSLLRSAPGG